MTCNGWFVSVQCNGKRFPVSRWWNFIIDENPNRWQKLKNNEEWRGCGLAICVVKVGHLHGPTPSVACAFVHLICVRLTSWKRLVPVWSAVQPAMAPMAITGHVSVLCKIRKHQNMIKWQCFTHIITTYIQYNTALWLKQLKTQRWSSWRECLRWIKY
jgi:hypothetical protein